MLVPYFILTLGFMTLNSKPPRQAVDESADRFEFGRNWRNFVERSFSQERVDISNEHLLKFLGCETGLAGSSFIDIGCGSGIHSLAAFQAGATYILSFDFDVESVKTTEYIRQSKADSPDSWQVQQGSILDEDYVASLGQYDIVYSWGVLHHTGDVWTAIKHSLGFNRGHSF